MFSRKIHRHLAIAPFIALALCSVFGCEVPEIDNPVSETDSASSNSNSEKNSETDIRVRDKPAQVASEWRSATHPVVLSWRAPWDRMKAGSNKDTEMECIQVFTTRDQKMAYVMRISSEYTQKDLSDETLNEATKKQLVSAGESAKVLDEGPAEIHGREFYRIRSTHTNANVKYCTYAYSLRDGTRHWGINTTFPFDQEVFEAGDLPEEYSSLNVTIGESQR